MAEIISSPMFGIILTVLSYESGLWLKKKCKTPAANPLLIAIIICIAFLLVFHIPLESYNKGGSIISMFLGPATAVLAISIYGQLETLKKNFIPIVAGCAVGATTSVLSVIFLSKAFGLTEELTASLIPKSVTTPIAMEIASQQGGIPSVTVAAVIITGIIGAIFAPVFIKIFGVKDSVEAGIAIGTCSHALGTTKAIEIGETEGAMSGIAIGVTGLITVIIAMFL